MSIERKSNDLVKGSAKCKKIASTLQQHIRTLLQQAEAQGTDDTLSEEALCSARNVIHNSNLLCGAVSELVRGHSPAEFSPEMDLVLHDPVYNVAVASDGLFLRVPIAPYSVQRNSQRKSAAGIDNPRLTDYWSRRRYSEVDALLDHVEAPGLYGKKLLYILHVYDTQSQFRASPDFDNYDVKDLIDVVTDHFGGDNPSNLAVCHDALYSKEMQSATYLAIVDLDTSSSIVDLIDRCQEAFEQTGQ